MTKQLGIFGGTFNPIHLGHLHIAEQTQQALALDQVIFLPSGDPPHKSPESLAPAHHRLAMVRLATEGHAHFRVSDREATSPDKSYTVHTLQFLREKLQGELWFMVGLDAFQDIASWKAADSLLELTNFVVLSRPGASFLALTSIPFLPAMPSEKLRALDTGTLDRLEIATTPTTRLLFLRLPPCHISASTIRQCLRQGHGVTSWLPPNVESNIIGHHLYEAGRGEIPSKT